MKSMNCFTVAARSRMWRHNNKHQCQRKRQLEVIKFPWKLTCIAIAQRRTALWRLRFWWRVRTRKVCESWP